MALHCPATLHLVGLDALPGALEALGQEHIAVVCVGGHPALRAAGESAATTLGAPIRVVPDLGDGGARHAVLGEIADQFRGEHVLVLVPGHHLLVTMEFGDDGVRHLG